LRINCFILQNNKSKIKLNITQELFPLDHTLLFHLQTFTEINDPPANPLLQPCSNSSEMVCKWACSQYC